MLSEGVIREYLKKLEDRLKYEHTILPVQQMREGKEACLKDIERLKTRIETIRVILEL